MRGSDDETSPQIVSLNLTDVLNGKDGSNPILRSGDIIRVVEAELKQAYVIGSVHSAAIINLKERVTLSTAIAMSGGVQAGAEIDKIKITRQAAGGLSKNDIFVDLKEIRNGSKEDVILQPNDIIDVPGPNGTTKFFKDILRTVVPVFTRTPMIIP